LPVKAHYIGKGFTIDPATEQNYFEAIEERLSLGPQAIPLTEEQVNLAWCYFDIYVHDWPSPFPWNLQTFREDIERWPIERVASEEGMAKFGDTFAVLAGKV